MKTKKPKQLRRSRKRSKYQLYDVYKKHPDPSMTREAWIKFLSKELKI